MFLNRSLRSKTTFWALLPAVLILVTVGVIANLLNELLLLLVLLVVSGIISAALIIFITDRNLKPLEEVNKGFRSQYTYS